MSSTVLNIVILVINIVLWFFFFIKYKRLFSPENILHSISDEVDKLLIEIDKSADRDLTLIEERTNNLRAMIDEADKRVQLAISEERKAELSQKGTKKINAATKSAANAYQRAKPQPAQNTNAEELTYRPEEHVQKKKSEHVETQVADALMQTELPFEVTVSEDFVQTEKTFQQKVIELWRQGLDTEFISGKLGVSFDEVQMIVDIYGN
ncbi:MAG: hypothetical protein KBT02_02790 [Treponema sp.]|nr:hypothetical protein [Candidatus Treponema caballi]